MADIEWMNDIELNKISAWTSKWKTNFNSDSATRAKKLFLVKDGGDKASFTSFCC